MMKMVGVFGEEGKASARGKSQHGAFIHALSSPNPNRI
jgi:hypothetical protein